MPKSAELQALRVFYDKSTIKQEIPTLKGTPYKQQASEQMVRNVTKGKENPISRALGNQ